MKAGGVIKIITTFEQIFETTEKGLKLVSQKIINSEVIQEDNTIQPKLFEFTSTDIRYGIISIRKAHELANLYSPNNEIKLTINGIEGCGKWHKTQCRISALTKLMDKAKVESNKKYTYHYDVNRQILNFKEYEGE